MTRPLFEQYKEALRRGHLAARAGRIEDALAAYTEAGRLAPDRAAPHTSRATVLHRAGRDPEAFAAFDKALQISPDDEATLRARAVTFREMRRLASAAADLERLAEALDTDGRRAEALTTAREALAITATPARRALVQRLEEPVDEAAPRQLAPRQPANVVPAAPRPAPAVAAPESAPEPISAAAAPRSADAEAVADTAEPPAPTPAAGTSSTLMDLYDAPIEEVAEDPSREIAAAVTDAHLDLAAATELGVEAAADTPEPAPDTPEPAPAPGGSLMDLYDAPIEGGIETSPVAATAASPLPDEASKDPHAAPLVPEMAALNAAVPGRISLDPSTRDPGSDFLIQLEPDADPSAAIPWPAIDLPSAPPPPIVGPPPDPEGLMAEALALIDADDAKAARNLLLTAVMVHRAAGRPDAAIDVCLQLLALFPGDAHVHLAIAGLQLDRGWRTLATEKIQLLLRLTALTGDTQAEADAHALMAERIHDEGPASFARA